jgi:hypothetical protein
MDDKLVCQTVGVALSEIVLPNVFQNNFSCIRKTAPPKEPQPEPFFEELKRC